MTKKEFKVLSWIVAICLLCFWGIFSFFIGGVSGILLFANGVIAGQYVCKTIKRCE